MEPSQIVDSYKYWDIASLWSREALQHESVAARALARGARCTVKQARSREQ
jgi:hypothetical protein